MPKHLKVSFPQKCIGCELCVFELQRQLGKIGLDGSLIRILKKKKETGEFIEYSIDIDPNIDSFDINKIKEICPTDIFEITRTENELL